MVRLTACALLAGAFLLSSCGSGDIARGTSKPKEWFEVVVKCDVDLAGAPSMVRFSVVDHEMASSAWKIDGQTYTSSEADGSVFVHFDHPGSVNATYRGVDKDGKDCTGPRGGVKFSARNGANAAPVVTNFDGPQDAGEGFERGPDGTLRRYHEWRWRNAQGYDPEEIEVHSWSWGLCDGGDVDGDGLPDHVLAGKNDDGSVFSLDPYRVQIRESPTKQSLRVIVYQNDTGEVDHEVRIVVTVTDAAAKSRKWGDGHVTLMK